MGLSARAPPGDRVMAPASRADGMSLSIADNALRSGWKRGVSVSKSSGLPRATAFFGHLPRWLVRRAPRARRTARRGLRSAREVSMLDLEWLPPRGTAKHVPSCSAFGLRATGARLASAARPRGRNGVGALAGEKS